MGQTENYSTKSFEEIANNQETLKIESQRDVKDILEEIKKDLKEIENILFNE